MRRAAWLSAALALLWAPAGVSAPSDGPSMDPAGEVSPVHDPALIHDGRTWRLFSTSQRTDPPGLIPMRASDDLITWRRTGTVLPELPAWAAAAVPGARGIWAPDISRVGGAYRLYYSISTFGSNRSVIGLATSTTLDPAARGYGWTDQGQVIASGAADAFNAIDPNLVVDASGGQWLAFGSFWSGIKLVRLDPHTGKPSSGAVMRSLAKRPAPGAVEAPFILRRGRFYYLFASYDFCCRGVRSSYYTVVGRAAAVTGPYLDRAGRSMTEGAGELVLKAADGDRFKGPGHVGLARDGKGEVIAWHAYDAENGGRSTLRLARLSWTADGWPRVAP